METDQFTDPSNQIASPIRFDRKLEAAKGINLIFSWDYSLYTFQFLGAPGAGGRAHSIVKLYTPTEKQKAFTDSLDYNAKGYDVYFMVNEGTSTVHPGKKTPRSQENVATLSKLFIDTDSCPIGQVNTYLDSINLTPHLTILSSTNRYHLYFYLAPEPKTPQTIYQWQTIQKLLHRLGDPTISPAKIGMDATMHDFSKVLRVPGFLHIKKKTLVTIEASTDLPFYNLNDLFTYFDFNASLRPGSFNQFFSSMPDLTAQTIILPGDRFNTLQALTMHLANTTSKLEAKPIYDSFVKQRLNNDDHVYYNGTLTKKSLDLFNSAYEKISKERIEVLNSAEDLNSTNTVDSRETSKRISAWHLPDSFYLNAPNNFGSVVQQVMNHSTYPCAALAFGTFITGLSILKSRTHFTPGGSGPALYTLNVAVAGYGKSDPMALLQNLFCSLNVGRLIANDIRSDRGIYAHLAANTGIGIAILDEVAPLLKTIQKDDANTHHAYIAKAILMLYSAGTMRGISLGKVASTTSKKGEKEIILDNPMLAILGFTVPEKFKTVFSVDSITSGLLQRFIPIVPEILFVEKNENSNPHAIISSDLFSIPASLIGASDINDEGEAVEPIESIVRQRMLYTPDARKLFESLCRDYRKKFIGAALNAESAAYASIYSRLTEQIERLATVLALDFITPDILDYSKQFLESRHEAQLNMLDNGMLSGEGSRSLEKTDLLYATLLRCREESKSKIVPKRELFRRLQRHFKNSRDFEEVLRDSVEAGKLVIMPNFRTKTTGPCVVGVSTPEIL